MTKAVFRMSDSQLFEYDDLIDLSQKININLDAVKILSDNKKLQRKLGYMFVERQKSVNSIEHGHNIYIDTMTGDVFSHLSNVTRKTGISSHLLKKLSNGETIERNGFSIGRFNTDYFQPKYHRAGENTLTSCVVKAKEMLFFQEANNVIFMDPITENLYKGVLIKDDVIAIQKLKGSERGWINIKMKDGCIKGIKKSSIIDYLVPFNRYMASRKGIVV